MKVGSLCSGAGGLDLAVEAVFGAHTVWHCEQDAAASKVLAARWPGVPNHGDLITTDWTSVEPVDIMCAGFPCQPFSMAGKRRGLDDERAIWPDIARAIGVLRPRIVVLENVSALLASAEFTRVADSLATFGYDLRWTCLRASDVGGPHRRERLFIVAYAEGERRARQLPPQPQLVSNRHEPAHLRASGFIADRSGDGRHEGRPESARLVGGSDAALSGDGPVEPQHFAGAAASLADGKSSASAGVSSFSYPSVRGDKQQDVLDSGLGLASVSPAGPQPLLPTPRQRDGKGATASRTGDNKHDLPSALLPTPSAADGDGGHLNRSGDRSGELLLPGVARAYGNGDLLPTPGAADTRGQDYARATRNGSGGDDLVTTAIKAETAGAWGKYTTVIAYWEQLTRPTAPPTEPNRNGKPRLNPAFSEWMMGWPARLGN